MKNGILTYIKFIEKDIKELDKLNDPIVICTSCEHLEQDIIYSTIEKLDEQIGKLQMEKRGYDNELRLLGRDSFDTLRQSRKLDSFLRTLDENTLNDLNSMGVVRSEEVSDIRLERFKEQRDNHSRNYNQLNLDGNVSVGSNTEVWR